MEFKNRIVIGLVETITILGNDNTEKELKARIDTGATKSSIDYKLARDLKLGPVVESRLVKSAHGSKLRPVVKATIIIKGKKISGKFTLADREHMKYRVLIGQNILKKGFLIDPNK